MKNKYLIVVLLLLPTFINAQFVGPKIYSMEPEYNFGKVVEGSIVVHDFVVTNNGDTELSLIKINSTCGCTVAKPVKEKIKPGDSTKISITFNSASRSGKQKKYINVFTNDKLNTNYRLSILADVVPKEKMINQKSASPKIFVEKNQHNFGKVKEGSVVSWDFAFKSVGNSTLIITDVKTSCGCTAALLSKDKLEPGESGKVKIELDTKGMKGKKSRTLAITSNDPSNPRMIITLFVDVEK
ncbi:MAG: DUF1573 domain-containing protein [Bacteroidetes bacterium]|nr:DUF1573 domain-containing protein [Patescibacteria group bacterium]MBU1114226.1 DUF1573 domain-containing protein [Bacteroidota bacterium]MBU1797356.1 DUF1573 domain-containing protein [Bacteroidota bacterium]